MILTHAKFGEALIQRSMLLPVSFVEGSQLLDLTCLFFFMYLEEVQEFSFGFVGTKWN